ncbi:MAG: GDP-mannose 4,6-dehydratase, partial [Cyclobacteriaceae bacterium]
ARDYTYIDDIMDCMLKSVKFVKDNTEKGKKIYEIFNVGESNTVKLNYLIELIEKSMNMTAKKIHLPNQMGDVPRTYADISKAKQILGYNPRTKIEDGIPKFAEWFLEMKNS